MTAADKKRDWEIQEDIEAILPLILTELHFVDSKGKHNYTGDWNDIRERLVEVLRLLLNGVYDSEEIEAKIKKKRRW